MDFEPTTETGKELCSLAKEWMKKSAKSAVDTLKRAFIMYSSEIINEDAFLAALYGQGVLNELPIELVSTKI